ncbi:MAG: tetratricopeptide repeat protein [Bacteroidales bacterium]|nr:tetratricopeptide repeat protein [Bacteroidales bacterium]
MKAYLKKSGYLIVLSFITLSVYAQSYDKGIKLLEQQQFGSAKNWFKQQLQKQASDARLWYFFGELYFTQNITDSANYCYSRGLSVNATDPINSVGIAKILFINSKPIDAKNSLLQIIKSNKNSKDLQFYLALAEAYKTGKEYTLALEQLNKAKDISKNAAEVFIKRGDIALAQLNLSPQKAGEAANEYERAAFYNKNYPLAYYKLGQLYVLARNYGEALIAFENVLKTDTNFIPVYKDLGELYFTTGKFEKAANAYSKYIKISEYNFNDIARYAQMLFFSKNYSESYKIIDKILTKDPNNFVMLRLQAYNSYETNDTAKALKSMNSMLKLVNEKNKLLINDYEYFAKILSATNRDSLAIIYYQLIIKEDSSQNLLYENIAEAYYKMKRYPQAIAYYKKYLKTLANPKSNDYHQLGRTCYIYITNEVSPLDTVTKKFYATTGDSIYSKVIELLPEHFMGYLYKARINAVLDPEINKGLAKPFYEQLTKITETNPEKYKKELIEAYSYLGYYYYVKNDIPTSKTFWEKILVLDPDDNKAKEALKGLSKQKSKSK